MQQLRLGDIIIDVEQKDIKNIYLSVHLPSGRVRIAAPLTPKRHCPMQQSRAILSKSRTILKGDFKMSSKTAKAFMVALLVLALGVPAFAGQENGVEQIGAEYVEESLALVIGLDKLTAWVWLKKASAGKAKPAQQPGRLTTTYFSAPGPVFVTAKGISLARWPGIFLCGSIALDAIKRLMLGEVKA